MDYRRFFSQFQYLSRRPGIGGRIKERPEDFVVREVLPKSIFENGGCLIYRLKKRNWDTMAAIKEIAKRAEIPYREIGFAGTKDRKAVTFQYISICGREKEALKERLDSIEIRDIELRFVGYGKRLRLGALLGNRFRIIVREPDVEKSRVLERVRDILSDLKEKGGFPNYFGYQRFGERRVINHEVGKLLLQGRFDEAAVKFLGEYSSDMEGDRARKNFLESGDVDRALEEFPRFLRYERAMLYRYKETRSWKKAFAVLPGPIMRIFIHSYQSYLFNRVLSRRIEEGLPLNEALPGDIICQVKSGIPLRDRTYRVTESNIGFVNEKIRRGEAMVTGPIFGYMMRRARGEMGRIEAGILEEEGISVEQFRMKSLKLMAEPGGRRELLIRPKEFRYGVLKDGSVGFKFFLPKGVYATSLLREIMKDH